MRRFNFPVEVLVAAARLGWINCKNGIADFAALRALYTLVYIEGKQNAIRVLAGMPDEFQRSEVHESLRIELKKKAKAALKSWRKLRRYVSAAYPELIQQKLKAIGREFLTAALKDNWTAVERLLNDGSTFIENNEAALMANDNMPAAYLDDYNVLLANFILAKDAFYLSEEDSEKATRARNIAADGLYAQLLDMLEDGQAVYADDEAARRTFVMEYLLEIVSPTGPAGLNGEAVFANGSPAAGVVVELENHKMSVIVDEDGMFNFGNNIASGKDRLIFKQGDEILKVEEVVIPAGVTVSEDVELPNVPPVA